jgi:hypothetical protein
MRLEGVFDDYRALPPAWRFTQPASEELPRSAWPQPGNVPGIGSSVFHTNPVICAPFNLLAYNDHGGPHSDWGGPANWLALRPDLVRATSVGEMLSVIALHLHYSPGRL